MTESSVTLQYCGMTESSVTVKLTAESAEGPAVVSGPLQVGGLAGAVRVLGTVVQCVHTRRGVGGPGHWGKESRRLQQLIIIIITTINTFLRRRIFPRYKRQAQRVTHEALQKHTT